MPTVDDALEHALQCEQQCRLDRAEQIYRSVIEIAPKHLVTWQRLAALLHRERRFAEAADGYRQLLALNPGSAASHNNLGAVLLEQGDPASAAESFRRSIQLQPELAEAHCNLGDALLKLRDVGSAIAEYREAIRARPDFAGAHYHLGVVYQAEHQFEEASHCYRHAVAIKPEFVEAITNLGVALIEQNRLSEAADCFDRALRLRPGYPTALESRGIVRLKQGDFAAGWQELEARWQREGLTLRDWDRPRWDGGDLAGRMLLAYAEQGLGDTIQFVRYAALVRQRGGKVVVECQKSLLPLLESCPAIDALVAQGDPLPPFDVQAPLMSLPGILGTTLSDVPADVPYLFPRPELVESWRTRLAKIPGVKIGIAWQGNPSYQYDQLRSIPLSAFAPLAGLPGVHLISLQKGAGSEQLQTLAGEFPVLNLGSQLDETTGPFLDTAAVMSQLDLVIASDSAVAHLAGALGVPVWVALSYSADWRWLMDRYDSPWYPTMRLFRQHTAGDWQSVFRRMLNAFPVA